MNWHIKGQYIEACSCKMLCPCLFGPAEPDQGWCSGQLTFDIHAGAVNGIELSGRKVVWVFDLPGDFVTGNGTARLFIDDEATLDQRRELEAVFTGKLGGPMAMTGALVTTWLPTKLVRITITGGENPAVVVGGLGHVKVQRIRDEAGNQTKLMGAPVLSAFQVEVEDLARSDGTQWSDPDMRGWRGGGSGGVGAFSWSA